MHIPPDMNMETLHEIHNFIHQYGFAIIVSDSLTASHIPLILNTEEGEFGTLYGHFSKTNLHWENIEGKKILVIFNGPNAYISPKWYSDGPAVPTWNYATVHAQGVISILDKQKTLEVVEHSIGKYEPELLVQRDIVTNDFRDMLLPYIVGFKIELSEIKGKAKLGQNQKPKNRMGVYRALSESNKLEDQALAKYMSTMPI